MNQQIRFFTNFDTIIKFYKSSRTLRNIFMRIYNVMKLYCNIYKVISNQSNKIKEFSILRRFFNTYFQIIFNLKG